MAFVETFLAAGIAGFGFLLAAVAFIAWKRASDRKMAVLGAAFAALGLGGVLLLLDELGVGLLDGVGASALAGAVLASLLLLYAALFARRK